MKQNERINIQIRAKKEVISINGVITSKDNDIKNFFITCKISDIEPKDKIIPVDSRSADSLTIITSSGGERRFRDWKIKLEETTLTLKTYPNPVSMLSDTNF